MNTIFIGAMAVHAPKYFYGLYLYEQANAGIAKWKLWHVGLENKYHIYCMLCLFMFLLCLFMNIYIKWTSLLC